MTKTTEATPINITIQILGIFKNRYANGIKEFVNKCITLRNNSCRMSVIYLLLVRIYLAGQVHSPLY
ncbi:MAG: hypothetical protein KAS35_06480, partial [Candidatus Marinimicrobia bacterium]|nr:hypothetical protein [Candidatus Neomarinimicrobiota bacterium]